MGDPIVGGIRVAQGDKGCVWIAAHGRNHTYVSYKSKIDIPYYRESDLSILMVVIRGGMAMVTKDRTDQFRLRLQESIEAALEASDLSARQASITVVGHDGLIRDIRNGRLPSPEKIEALCELLGLEFYIGTPRAQPTATGFAEAAKAYLSVDGDKSVFDSGFVPIPYHRADLAHRDLSHVALSRSWLEQQGLDPDALFAIVMPNDDMAPAIAPGAVLLVDTRAKPEPEADLMACIIDGHLRIGWTVLPKAGCLVVFYNRAYSVPAVMAGKKGVRIEPIGRVAARLDLDPAPWIDREEKTRLLKAAQRMTE